MINSTYDRLIRSINNCDVAGVKHFLSMPGIDPNNKGIDGLPLMTIAVRANFLQIAKILLDNKANINELDDTGQTALFHAADYGSKESVELLLERGINVNHLCHKQSNALMAAVESGYTDCIQFILAKTENINQADSKGNTALHYAINCQIDIDEPEIVTHVELLLKQGSDYTLRNSENQSAMDIAKEKGFQGVERLLRAYQDQGHLSALIKPHGSASEPLMPF